MRYGALRSMTIGVFAFGLILSAQTLFAQTEAVTGDAAAGFPRVIQYSGELRDSGGQALVGVQGVTLAIYASQRGGAALWMETQNVAADATGRYTVLLGSATSAGLPVELFAGNEARWLGVTAANGGDEQERALLVAVPYALKAADAETLGGLPASAYALAKDVVGSTKLVGDQAGLPVAGYDQVIVSQLISGTTGYLAKFVGPAVDDVGNSALFETAGKIGIGTTTPEGKLHLVDPESISMQLEANGTGQFTNSGFMLRVKQAAAANSEWLFFAQKDSPGAVTGTSSFQIRRRDSNQNEAITPFVITGAGDIVLQAGFTTGGQTNGKVGIGLPIPTEMLEVVGTVKATNFVGNGAGLTGVATLGANTFSGTLSANSSSTSDFTAGVTGNATGPSGITYGVQGSTSSTTNDASGVRGVASQSSGQTYGVSGHTNSTSNFAAGVFGNTNGGETYGVSGNTNSIADFTAGVQGHSSGASGQTRGVMGTTNSTTNNAAGVAGRAAAYRARRIARPLEPSACKAARVPVADRPSVCLATPIASTILLRASPAALMASADKRAVSRDIHPAPRRTLLA
ncbi:MAG: hypothetical protein A3F68_06735 [Acidobacteria bacterium RIFCSPLOWO2_12_FULL_54_10]|nr:MAG: hypothetical protein A3F68_06735 [Acidobacteria bacterium RIFCSPLOWO2_12_FULL_54_10]